jgi:hypothetical protein
VVRLAGVDRLADLRLDLCRKAGEHGGTIVGAEATTCAVSACASTSRASPIGKQITCRGEPF